MKYFLKIEHFLKISGNDAEDFLQNQFQMILKLDSNKVQFNAYCQHQGKLLHFLGYANG